MFVSLKCPDCGSQQPDRTEEGDYKCPYCGNLFIQDRPREVELPQVPSPSPSPPPAAANRSSSGRASGLLASLLIIVGAGIAAVRSFGVPGVGGVSHFVQHRFYWDDVGGPPIAATTGGREVVVGRIRVYLNETDELRIAVIDAATIRDLWRTPPLGSYSDAYRDVHFAVSGDRVVVSDPQGRLHIHELATGKETALLQATDRVERLCVPAAGDSVFATVVDGHHLSIDLQAGTARVAPRPADCAGHGTRHAGNGTFHQGGAPHVDGFAARHVRVADGLAVASGGKSPGTATPIVVGYDPAMRAVRWKEPLGLADASSVRPESNDLDALVDGRYVALYGVGSDKGYHLTALDAKTGARLWDTALRNIFAVDTIAGLLATPTRVYVTRTSSLDVFDATTGKLVGVVGDETYE